MLFYEAPEPPQHTGENLSGPKIVQIDVGSTKAHLPDPFIGSEATSILKALGKDHPVVKSFKTKV